MTSQPLYNTIKSMIDAILNKLNKLVPQKWRWVLNHEGFRKYFKNTGWMFFGQMFSLLVSFFIGAWIARYLGPKNYGIVNYVIAFVGLFGFISYLGIDGILNRELVNHPEKRDELLGTAFVLKLFSGCLALIVASAAALIFNSNNLIRALLILFSLSYLIQAPSVINIYFQAEVKAKENIKAQLIGTLISSILKVALILFGGGVIWLVLIYAVDFIWQSQFLFYFYKQQGLKFSAWRYKSELARSIWHDGWPLMLSLAAASIYLKIDQVMIGKIMGEMAVGIYAAGVKITEIFYFIPSVVCVSLFPAIINAKKAGREIYEKRLRDFYYLLIFLALIITLPIAILAKPIISLLFGAQYLAAVPILRIYIWSSLGLFLWTGMGQYLTAENRTRIIFWLNLLAMLVNVIINLIFIPLWGLTGAAWATLIAYSVAPLSLFIFQRKNNR